MPASIRLKTTVPADQHERFATLAAAQGVSASKLLSKLVWTAVAETPEAKLRRLAAAAKDNKAPAEKTRCGSSAPMPHTSKAAQRSAA